MLDTSSSTTETWWFAVLTLIIGYVLKAITDRVEHHRTLERERETRNALRRDQLAEQRRNFQRETLLQLQESVADLARSVGEVHFHDMRAFRQSGRWGRAVVPEDLDERNRAASARAGMLKVRVRDESVRQLMTEVERLIATATFGKDNDTAEAAMRGMALAYEKLQQRIGEVLRSIEDEAAISLDAGKVPSSP